MRAAFFVRPFATPIREVKGRVVFCFRKISTLKPLTARIFTVSYRRWQQEQDFILPLLSVALCYGKTDFTFVSEAKTQRGSVEKAERYKTAQLAREIELALPIELAREQNINLVREYAKQHFVDAGMCADICIHDKQDGNPHAHIMLTMRPIKKDSQWGQKSRSENGIKIPTTDWNEQTKAEEWRNGWANFVNRFLEQNNVPERVDHRSYERQGIEQIPTIHMSVAASAMERKGIRTDKGNTNRKIISTNQELRQLRARIGKLQKWLDVRDVEVKAELAAQNFNHILSENLILILSDMLNTNEGKTRWHKIADPKSAASALAFLHANSITTLFELSKTVTAMRGEVNIVRDKLKPVERRLTTLDEHIKQGGNYKTYKAIQREYKSLKPKQQVSFYDAHTSEIILFENAEKYLKAHLNGHNRIPLVTWKAEREKLTAQKNGLY